VSTFQLTLEAFAGTDIDSACSEAVRLADLLQVVVVFPFNGVTCMARPGDHPDELASVWADELKSSHTYKLACASRYQPPAERRE
jgi:hypothetical protein